MCRRIHSYPEPPLRRQRHGPHKITGVALVIVLAFIVLLSGVIIAFFSHSANELQLSSSSVNQVKVDLLGQGALDTVIGDLKQEIVAGSLSPVPTPATGVTLYIPKAAINAVPARDPVLSGVAGYENLVKRSSTAQPFPNSASNQAAGPSSMVPALNGQYISAARWNNHLLLQKDPAGVNNAADFTPTGAKATTWMYAPEWVIVKKTEDLSNPTTQWNSSLAVGGANPAVGRYAYAIYDEGGLLDMNAAGYPSVFNNTSYPSLLTKTQYKGSLAYADLRQLPGVSALTPNGTASTPLSQDKLLNDLVGFRNFAASAFNPVTNVVTAISGNFPGFTWSGANGANYDSFLASAANGFLTAANVPRVTATSKAVTEHPYLSRQEFMRIVLQYITSADVDRAKLEDVFQYLGTFSRAYNQPSFIKPQSVDPTAVGYNANAPKILAAASGGNNATGLDAAINPAFLSARVKTVFARNDGYQAVVGDPLVNKRFSLNRLSWLTCKGPICADDTGTFSSDSDVQTIISIYENTYGLSPQFLKLGGPANILKYFGLQWDTSSTPARWKYVHGRNVANGPIMKLNYPTDSNDVARANRDADFFELLKSGINAGSIAKTISPLGAGDTAFQAQYSLDSSVDYAIIQIGANMIDQFDPDSFPTRIAFDDGGGVREFRGVENLPYIYRVRNSIIKVAAPTVGGTSSPYGGTDYPSDTNAITNTGVAAFMQYPDLWNPHDWNATNLDETFGVANLGPTQFRIYATTNTPIALNAHDGGSPPGTNPSSGTTGTEQAASPGYNTLYGFPWVGELRSLNQANTEMTFKIDRSATGASLFREPTILFQPGHPTGSNMASTAIANKSGLGILGSGPFFAGGGIRSDVDATDGTSLPVKGNGYVGFYLGAHPLQWMKGSTRDGARQTGIFGTATITYTLQCQDDSGQWITYDEKIEVITGNPDDHLMRGAEWGFIHNQGKFGNMATVMDPRTGRFNLMSTYVFNGYGSFRFPPWTSSISNDPNKTGWLNKAESIIASDTNGYAAGVAIYPSIFKNSSGVLASAVPAVGWYPGNWETGNGSNPAFQPGLFAQNNPSLIANKNLADQLGNGSDGTPSGPGAATYYADPDGVVRRASGGNNTQTAVGSGASTTAATAPGLPNATALTAGLTYTTQSNSRPIVLNRPFRTVAELGCVFSGTPWKNLDFMMPESGDTALLDVFSIQDTEDPNGMIAGRVNLNTRQKPVLQAILAGAYKDEWNPAGTTIPGGAGGLAASIADALVTRTTSTAAGKGPLRNVGELVGAWKEGASNATPVMPTAAYDGFSADLTGLLASGADTNIQRYREATLRALANSGQTRVWNLMIDLVAQTGRYPQTATSLDKFSVEGEQRYWLHVAIDRYTGNVIDKQLEIVKE